MLHQKHLASLFFIFILGCVTAPKPEYATGILGSWHIPSDEKTPARIWTFYRNGLLIQMLFKQGDQGEPHGFDMGKYEISSDQLTMRSVVTASGKPVIQNYSLNIDSLSASRVTLGNKTEKKSITGNRSDYSPLPIIVQSIQADCERKKGSNCHYIHHKVDQHFLRNIVDRSITDLAR